MANTASSALRVTELDFDSIKNNLKNYLRSQPQFQDFDFEGSGMSVLLDILAYNTHYMGYYLNMTANEMFLDTAQLRASVLSHAKSINYVPNSAQGALLKANVIATPVDTEDNITNIATLDRYTKFVAKSIDGINYPFVALYSNTVSKTANTFQFNNIMLKQGEVNTLQYFMDPTNTSRRFEIPSANVDLTTLSITVQQSSSNSTLVEYKLAEDITELTGNSAVYFIEENQNSNYTFYFGDNIIGKKPDVGNIITVNYLDVVGSIANNISKVFVSDPINGKFRNNVTVVAANSSYGGTEKESLEQVRFRAPYFYTTQNRAVTKRDYETLITKDYNNIDSVAIWGGEDNDPVIYGKVFLSLKTKNNYFLTNQEKEVIKEDLIRKRNVLTITPEIIDPDYTYLLLKGTVNYNESLTGLASNQLLQLVKAAISNYNNTELNSFSSTFRKSRLQQYIDNCDKSILSSDISVYVQKRFAIDTVNTKTYNIVYNMPLQKGDYFNKGYSYPEVQSFDSAGITRNIIFEETPFSATGVDRITILNGGKNYFDIPTVTISGDGTGATAKAVVQNGVITAIDIITKGSNYSRADVVISSTSGTGAIADARLEAKTGILRSFYYNANGEKEVVNESAGTVDFDTGLVTISALRSPTGTPTNTYYDTDVLTLNFPLEREIILPLRNRIISIDLNDPLATQINMVAEK